MVKSVYEVKIKDYAEMLTIKIFDVIINLLKSKRWIYVNVGDSNCRR